MQWTVCLRKVSLIQTSRQRVLTPAEYAALGYVERPDFDPSMFEGKADEPLSKPFIDIAYRADTKEEYYIDVGVFLFKLGYAASTGGIYPVGQVVVREFLSLVN